MLPQFVRDAWAESVLTGEPVTLTVPSGGPLGSRTTTRPRNVSTYVLNEAQTMVNVYCECRHFEDARDLVETISRALHAPYPQYDKRFGPEDPDGPWRFARITKRWWSKGNHSVFEVGDDVLVTTKPPSPADARENDHRAFCLRSGSFCALEPEYFRWL